MITFEHENLKSMKILKNGEEITTLELISGTLTNKFFIIETFITRLSDMFCSNEDSFEDWFEYFILAVLNDPENRYQIIVDNIEEIKRYVDAYFEHAGIDFSLYCDEQKAKKTTILFQPEEIKLIAKNSGYLKIYAMVSNVKELRLDSRLHKSIYNLFLKDIIVSDITNKIYSITKTKTYKYNFTDRFMWQYIELVKNKPIELHVIEIFNFIMNYILILCEETKNPVTYFVTVIDESIKWFLRSVYKTTVIYEDSIATENIQGNNINNLKTYSFNDTLGRLKGISYEWLHRKFDDDSNLMIGKDCEKDNMLVDFQNRIQKIEYVNPICENFMFPLLAKATKIPYSHFKMLSPEHSAVLSSFIQNIFRNVFKSDYKHIIDLLAYYPTNPPPIATTYKVKDMDSLLNYQNQKMSFYGFNTRILPATIISHFVGRVSRISFRHIYSDAKLNFTSLLKVEADFLKFYTVYFANGFNDHINEINRQINYIL